MSERPTDFQLARRLLRDHAGFVELAGGRRAVILVGARVVPDPGERPLEMCKVRSLEPDSSVRTELVFDDDGALVADECSINGELDRGGG